MMKFANLNVVLFLALLFTALMQAPLSAKIQEEEKLTFPKNAPTAAQYRADSLKFHQHELELYRKHTSDSDEQRKSVEAFLLHSVRLVSEQKPGENQEANWVEPTQLGRAAVKSGSTDPIFLSHYSYYLSDRMQTQDAEKVGNMALQQLRKSDAYPKAIEFLFLHRNLKNDYGKNYSQDLKEASQMLKLVPAWFAWYQDIPGGQRRGWHLYSQYFGRSEYFFKSKTPAIIKQVGEIDGLDPWTWEMIQGCFHLDIAWAARGSSFAKDVPKDGWKTFRESAAQAGKHFRAAYKIAPENPEAAAFMIGIAMAAHDDDSEEEWFERAVAAEIDYKPAYRKLINSMFPRWGGSHEAILEFGRKCGRTERFDSDVPFYLVQAVFHVKLDGASWNEIFSNDGLYEELKYVLLSLKDDPTRATEAGITVEQARYLSTLLYFSLKADLLEKDAPELWDLLGDDFDLSHLPKNDFDVDYERSRCFAYREFPKSLRKTRKTGQMRHDEVAGAEMVLQSGNRLATFRDLLDQSKDPRSTVYLKLWADISQQELDFAEGKWVDLKFEPKFRTWFNTIRLLDFENENSVSAKLAYNERLAFYSKSAFPGPKEVVVDIEMVSKKANSARLGIHIGDSKSKSLTFWIDPFAQVVGLGLSQEYAKKISWKNPTKRVRALVWDLEHIEFYIDGMPFPKSAIDYDVFKEAGLEKTPSGVGFGQHLVSPMSGVARFSNIRVRKLPFAPYDSKMTDDEELEYLSNRIKHDPANFDLFLSRGLNSYPAYDNHQQATTDLKFGLQGGRSKRIWSRAYLAQLLLRQGKYAEAIRQHQRAHSEVSQLENKNKNYVLSFCHANRALTLGNAPNDKLRAPVRALKIAQAITQRGYDKPDEVWAWLALAAIQTELGDFEEAQNAIDQWQELEDERRWHKKWHIEVRKQVQACIEKKQPFRLKPDLEPAPSPSFTLLKLKGIPETSSPPMPLSNIERTTNDQAWYDPWFPKYDLPVHYIVGGKEMAGFHADGKTKKDAICNYEIVSGHTADLKRPMVAVDLFGRKNQRHTSRRDNDLDVVLLYEGEEVSRINGLAIPDIGIAHRRVEFPLAPETKIDQIRVIGHPSDGPKNLFTLMEVRAAAMEDVDEFKNTTDDGKTKQTDRAKPTKQGSK